MQTKNIVIVVVIIVTALILGVLAGNLLKQQRASVSEETPTEPSPTQPAPTPPGSFLEGLPPPPGENASEEEKRAFFDAVQQMAIETETIEVGSSCTLSPVIAKIKPGTSFTFANNDSVDHVVTTFTDKELMISAQDSVTIESPTSGGIYGVVCDTMQKGLIMLPQQ